MEFGNERNDKGFFIKIFIAIVVLVLLIGGYFYVVKQKTPLVTENNQSVPLPQGFERDMENKISTEFPKGLIVEKDITNVVESFTVSKEGQETQYTFRYVSKKSLWDNSIYFSKYLSTNGWHIVGIPTNTKTFMSLSSERKQIEKVFITINEVESTGVIVDVTYIK